MRATIMYSAGDVRVENVSDGCRAMNDRAAIKVMVEFCQSVYAK